MVKQERLEIESDFLKNFSWLLWELAELLNTFKIFNEKLLYMEKTLSRIEERADQIFQQGIKEEEIKT